MKNINLDHGHLVIKRNAGGSILTGFGIIAFIIAFFEWGTIIWRVSLVVGIILLIVSFISILLNSKKKYLEVNQELMIIYPTSSLKLRYEIPLTRIECLTHKHRQKSRNTEALTIVLNNRLEPDCFWINGNFKEKLSKKELDLEYLPIKTKDESTFIEFLEKDFAIRYQAPPKTFLNLTE